MSSDYRWDMRYVVLGENLIDLLPEDAGAPTTGESRWVAHSGGSPLNTAAALGRLGMDTQYLGRLSTDAFGRQNAQHLEAHGVGLDVAVTTSDPSTLAVVSVDEHGKATYAFHTHDTSNLGWSMEELPTLEPSQWLHFGSIGLVVDPAFEVLSDYIARVEVRKSFDVNIRPLTISSRDEYVAKIHRYLSLMGGAGNIVKGSDEDLEWLHPGDPFETAKAWCREFGLESVVITLGYDGVAAVNADGIVARHPGFRVDVVDTVGAGDTFMAGYLAKIPDGDVAAALAYGSAAAALVCTRAGAQPPTADEVARFLG